MKTFYILTLFCLLSSLCQAQTLVETQETETKVRTESPNAIVIDRSAKHTESATKQIREHVITNTRYPEIMIEHGFEGTIEIGVSISDSGKVMQRRISKSDLSSTFNKAVLKALGTLKVIKIKEKKYEGVSNIYMPIHFSLGN